LDVTGSYIYTVVDFEFERTKHVVKARARLLLRTKKADVVDKGDGVSYERRSCCKTKMFNLENKGARFLCRWN